RTASPARGGLERTGLPRHMHRFDAKSVSTEGLVRRVTPFAAWLFIGLFAIAALFVGVTRSESAAEGAAIVLLAAIGVVAVTVFEVMRLTARTAATAQGEAEALRLRDELLS